MADRHRHEYFGAVQKMIERGYTTGANMKVVTNLTFFHALESRVAAAASKLMYCRKYRPHQILAKNTLHILNAIGPNKIADILHVI